MIIGQVMRVKTDQSYTCKDARGKLCVIEMMIPDRFSDGEFGIYIRIQDDFGCHYTQSVRSQHLEEV